ncbi:MAG: DNA-directed RNA polymerase subunit omega, partial [Spirochaetaceae bacterium]|nr:DNA-directed RNA polymerase subunit omega [Spirochaetaceae bacterium]
MIFPLEQLIEFKGNVYEITCAANRRAYQLSMVRDPEIEENDGKVVSLAARQVL